MNKLTVTGVQEFMGTEIPVIAGGFGDTAKCISDKTVAEIHEVPVTEIRKSIGRNSSRFKENVDFIDLKIVGNEITNILGYTQMQISKAEHIYLLSERGYAKLIKIMDKDLAWEVHDRLMDEYFQMREDRQALENLSPELHCSAGCLRQWPSSNWNRNARRKNWHNLTTRWTLLRMWWH